MTADPFYVGFAISVYQNSGDDGSNWGHWVAREGAKGTGILNGSKIMGEHKLCGESCDFWNLYEEDILRAKNMGSNSFRFSLEWSRLQPKGPSQNFDETAVQRFHAILDCLKKHGLEPFCTLHHYVHPQWFEDMGGFEKQSNISYFVEYALQAFKEYGSRIRFWATFNEPGVTSFAGFIHGSFPPGKFLNISLYGRHLLHMLIAHAEAYDGMKCLPGGDKVSIGIVHNWFTFEAAKQCCCIPICTSWVARFLNNLWGNELLLDFLQTGSFDFNPFWGGICSRITYQYPRGKPGCDHFGLNYYSRGLLDWKLAPTSNAGEIMTDMPYALHAQGLLDALERISILQIPMYITETGVADKNDSIRPIMIQTYMSAIEEARRKGFDLRGVLYWTLVDNFEWSSGFTQKFGIFEWDPTDQSKSRKFRKSGKLLEHWFDRLKNQKVEQQHVLQETP